MFNNSVVTANFVKYNLSFNESYTERVLGVSRPQMNESRLDPDTYLGATYAENVHQSRLEYSMILKEWLAPLEDVDEVPEKIKTHPI